MNTLGDELKPEERAFLTRIKQAVTTNPFSSDRTAIDMKLAGLSSAGSTEEVFGRLNRRVSATLDEIGRKQNKRSATLGTGDLELLRYGKLFQIFYQFSGCYDRLIQEQIRQGDESSPVTFSGEVLKRLAEAGFSVNESLRFFALFFQMRRAFFFINRIAGTSNCVQELRKSLWNNIFTDDIELYDNYLWDRMEDFSTMLLGETGTGKGLAASAIGRSGFIPFDEKRRCFSESFAETFVAINLSQYPESLIESELFGHRKGAFTGAIEPYRGVFSRCSPCGSIFIDEIGDVSIPVQIKLLKVLEEREFTPVGSHKKERFQGRVIAATNQPLAAMRKAGKFREDFYYRLCSDVIRVPPLKQRLEENPDEIEVILTFIIKRILGEEALDLVEKISTYISKNQPCEYSWPGNIRELEQCARQILLRQSYGWQKDVGERAIAELLTEQTHLTAQQLLSRYCQGLYRKHGTYEAVARLTELDRRTVRKYIVLQKEDERNFDA